MASNAREEQNRKGGSPSFPWWGVLIGRIGLIVAIVSFILFLASIFIFAGLATELNPFLNALQ